MKLSMEFSHWEKVQLYWEILTSFFLSVGVSTGDEMRSYIGSLPTISGELERMELLIAFRCYKNVDRVQKKEMNKKIFFI